MCNIYTWPPNLALDDNLIEEARRAGGHKTKKEAVTAALAEYVKRRKQMRIWKHSAPSISIRSTITKPSAAERAPEYAISGRHAYLVFGPTPNS